MLIPVKMDTGFAMLATEGLLMSTQMIVACVLVPSSLDFESHTFPAVMLPRPFCHLVYIVLISTHAGSICFLLTI
jgi:hypothetical protein